MKTFYAAGGNARPSFGRYVGWDGGNGVAFSIDRTKVLAILKWTGIVVGTLIVALAVALLLIDWNALRGPISRFASTRLHRPVTIEHIDAHVRSFTPRFTFQGVTVGNPEWEKREHMLELQSFTVQINLPYLLRGDVVLPTVVIERPRIYLHRAGSGHANWEFATTQGQPEKDAEPAKLPVVRRFLVNDGRVEIIDEVRKLKFEGSVQARERASDDDAKPFRIQGKGELNDKPFSLTVAGGPLINLDPNEPYQFDGRLEASNIKLAASGTLPEPFDLGRLSANLAMSGEDLADLYYLTELALPNTPEYELSLSVERNGTSVGMRNIAGRIGSSDVRGDLSLDTSGERPYMRGELASDLLDFADLAAPLGTEVDVQSGEGDTSTKTAKSKVAIPPNTPLLPDSKLQVNRVRAMDADVGYKARAVKAGKMPLKHVAMQLKLNDGVLSLQPFAMDFPQGKLAVDARIDATKSVPHVVIDMRLNDLRLDQFAAKKPGAQPPLAGVMQARVQLQGSGDSIHGVASTADGTITAVVPHGEVRAAFAELTGINVARGIGLLLAADQQKADLRCGVADFEVNDGVMRAKNIVIDTQDVLITGKGDVRLQAEQLDLEIQGHPKKPRFVRLRTPIEIGGNLRKPAVAVDKSKTATQAGVAAAIGALIAPLAAVVAFVDPGLAKDADCAALFAEAGGKTAR
jgi:AsmA family protein